MGNMTRDSDGKWVIHSVEPVWEDLTPEQQAAKVAQIHEGARIQRDKFRRRGAEIALRNLLKNRSPGGQHG